MEGGRRDLAAVSRECSPQLPPDVVRLAAVKRYNNVQLDGKPMKIDFVGTNISAPTTGTPALGAFSDSNVAPPSAQGRSGFARARTGRRGRGFGRGRGRVRDRDLHADAFDCLQKARDAE